MFDVRGPIGANLPELHGQQIYIRPPRPVWVDLGAVFRIGRPRRHVADGMDMQATVPGELSIWSVTTTGHWVGYVSFALTQQHRAVRVSQWVLEDALRPRQDAPARPEQRGYDSRGGPHRRL